MIPPELYLKKKNPPPDRITKNHSVHIHALSEMSSQPYPWCRFGCKMTLIQANLPQVLSPDLSHLIYVVSSPQTFKVTAAISLANRPPHCILFLCQNSTRQLGLSMLILGEAVDRRYVYGTVVLIPTVVDHGVTTPRFIETVMTSVE